jgi:hypothetical protein
MSQGVCPWSDWAPATMKFCEQSVCGWITQPANTWSNLAFLVVGAAIVLRASARRETLMALLGWSTVILGVGSFLFHMSGTSAFEIFDVSGMFLVSGLMLSFNLRRYARGLSNGQVTTFFFALTGLSIAVLVPWTVIGVPLFAVQLSAILTIELLIYLREDPVDFRYAAGFIGVFAVSLAVWSGDIRGFLCRPENHVLTGHAVWHLLNATAIWLIYLFYRDHLYTNGARGAATHG